MAKKKIKSKKKKKTEKVKTYQLICEDCGRTKTAFKQIIAKHVYCNVCVLKANRLKQSGVLYFR